MILLDGQKIASELVASLKEKIALLKTRKPSLTVIIVGDNPASKIYVSMKKKTCEKIGITSSIAALKESISQEELKQEIEKLNKNPAIDAILIQLPLPNHMKTIDVFSYIDPEKDVDCFHPLNVGKLFLGEENGIYPCTPSGIVYLLEKYQIDLEGRHVVILGRSNIVGKPLAAMLMQNRKGLNATVTVAHSKTKNIKELTLSADVIVAALGKAKFITEDMVKKNAVVIDVGINRDENNKISGDVDFENVAKKASYITPVPKGIGPLTIAKLLENTYKLYIKKYDRR